MDYTNNINVVTTSGRDRMLSLDTARWRLAVIWFPIGGLIFLILIGQSIGGVYGSELSRVWGWALPNFLPTLALMVSVFAADALKSNDEKSVFVRRNFCLLAICLSVFYLMVFLLPILLQPFIPTAEGTEAATSRILMLETSNLWLGPLQGMVVISLGVLFFLKENEKKPGGA